MAPERPQAPVPRRRWTRRRPARARHWSRGPLGPRGGAESWRGFEPALEVVCEPLEQGGELGAVGMIGWLRRNRHAGSLLAEIGQENGAEIRVLDRPSVTLHGGNRHAERDGGTFPRHDDRVHTGLAAGVLLNRPGDGRRRAGGNEFNTHRTQLPRSTTPE